MHLFELYFVDIIRYHYADFNGRARRKEYWMFYLFACLLILGSVIMMEVTASSSEVLGGLATILFGILFLGLILPLLAVTVRRLHDTGRSGIYYFMSFIPFVGGFIMLYYTVIEGDHGPNQYGEDPKDPFGSTGELEDFQDVLGR